MDDLTVEEYCNFTIETCLHVTIVDLKNQARNLNVVNEQTLIPLIKGLDCLCREYGIIIIKEKAFRIKNNKPDYYKEFDADKIYSYALRKALNKTTLTHKQEKYKEAIAELKRKRNRVIHPGMPNAKFKVSDIANMLNEAVTAMDILNDAVSISSALTHITHHNDVAAILEDVNSFAFTMKTKFVSLKIGE